jgi:GTP-binding protein
MAFATWAPMVRTSAKTGRSCERTLDFARNAAENRASRVQTSKLNNMLDEIRQSGHTIVKGNRRLKLNYATQANTCPPAFTFFCNAPDLVDDNFERFIENRLRERIDLEGTPVRLKFRKKG